MFILDKLLTVLMLPSGLMVECLLLGMLLRTRPALHRVGAVLAWASVSALAACLLLPVDNWAIRPLEDRFPAVSDPPPAVDGIIVLGGAIDDLTSLDRNTPILGAAANRITSFVALARRYPEARLVFSGGSGDLQQGLSNEARYARILFSQLGVPAQRIRFEAASRTTRENALDTSRLLGPPPRAGERWVLLTSASHMPRAVGVFRKVGWNVLPWPVGYQSRDHVSVYGRSLGQKLALLDWAAHEWAGLVVYFLRGWTSALFPAPAAGERAHVAGWSTIPSSPGPL